MALLDTSTWFFELIFSLINAKHFLIETEDNDESSDKIENNSAEEESSKVSTAKGNWETFYFTFSCIHIFRNQYTAKCPAKQRVGVFL